MTPEQELDLKTNNEDFCERADTKYRAGQVEHTGNLWEMGAYQALNNAKDEIVDMWQYVMTIEKILKEIENLEVDGTYEMAPATDEFEASIYKGRVFPATKLKYILNRRKKD